MWIDKIDIELYTPMMQQYLNIKKSLPDALLFFRLGEFYELFFEDARVGAQVLEIVLTGREAGTEERIPMCGIPAHSAYNYFSKLVENGYKVAIAEQVEKPGESKGIVKREVVSILTPGTEMNQNIIGSRENLYIGAISVFPDSYTLTIADLSTGEIKTGILPKNTKKLVSEVLNFDLKELVLPTELLETDIFSELQTHNIFLSVADDISINAKYQKVFASLDDKRLVVSVAKLLNYAQSTMKKDLNHLLPATVFKQEINMRVDYHSKRSLELDKGARSGSKKGSLLSVLDKTKTAMGGRLLKQWLDKPLIQKSDIIKRHEYVEVFKSDVIYLNDIRQSLETVYDVERLAGKVAFGTVNPKEVANLRNALKRLPQIKETLSKYDFDIVKELVNDLGDFNELTDLLDNSIVSSPPLTFKEGGIIKTGYHEVLDEYKDISLNGKDWIIKYENEQRERTGIKSLKVGYNKVFGYFIDVRRTNLALLKDCDDYERKQTLANSERYFTPTLKEMETKILHAEENIIGLEYDLFLEVREFISKYIRQLQKLAKTLAFIDVVTTFSIISLDNNYVRPEFTDEHFVALCDGRHPVVELATDKGTYVPNDILMDQNTDILLITGPNMSGKSTYMRQMALTAIMAQIGCFVPARKAILPVFDQIFTRIGASDDLSSGQSTFMVEMLEAGTAIKEATKNSLIIFDEIGRGTSTYDGMALAQAMLEHIHEEIGAKLLFSTHYHELTKLDEVLNKLKNVHVQAAEEQGGITFFHKVHEGPTSKSYGVLVAKLADLPDSLIKRADVLLLEHEQKNPTSERTLFDFAQFNESKKISKEEELVLQKVKEVDPMKVTPIDALNLLFDIKSLIDN